MDILTIVASTITGVVTFLVGLRKARREVESLGLENISKSLEIYNHIISGLKEEIIELSGKVKELEDKIDFLSAENQSLKEMLRKRK